MPPGLAIFGYSEAAMFLRSVPVPPIAGIISIHGPREFGVPATTPRRLDLHFDDIEIPAAADTIGKMRR